MPVRIKDVAANLRDRLSHWKVEVEFTTDNILIQLGGKGGVVTRAQIDDSLHLNYAADVAVNLLRARFQPQWLRPGYEAVVHWLGDLRDPRNMDTLRAKVETITHDRVGLTIKPAKMVVISCTAPMPIAPEMARAWALDVLRLCDEAERTS